MRLLLIYSIILAFLSLNPWLRPDSGLAIDGIAWDKVDHAIAYCVLSWLMMSAFKHCKHLGFVGVLVLIVSSWTGVLLEYCQLWFTSTREFSKDDAIASAFGATLGVILFFCYWGVVRVKS